MAYNANRQVREYERKRRRRSAWKKVLGVLGCLVVFFTTYALILPALTEEHPAYCGVEEHTHAEDCYQTNFICGLEESHTHTDACYDGETLICGMAEAHFHTQDCYEIQSVLTCGLDESVDHAHTDACYEEQQVLTCALPEAHFHTDDCIEKTMICETEEHTHTLSCFSNPEADVETAEDWEKTLEDVTLTGNYAQDLLSVAETQLGYQESTENYIVLEDGETVKGYTRYGAWYGMPYEDWCAMFVSFCLNYAQVSPDDFPRDSSCQNWVQTLTAAEWDLYTPAEFAYIPAVGDLVFLDYTDGAADGDGVPDHVGVVSNLIYDEEAQSLVRIETIESRSGGSVQRVEYDAASPDIMGYGRLPEGSWKSLTCEGEDYAITVTYSGLARLPEDVTLEVAEILSGTEEYDFYAAWAAQAMGEEEGAVTRRFFDITLLSGGVVVEPAAPVSVSASFPDQPVAEGEDMVIHFPDSAEPDLLTAEADPGLLTASAEPAIEILPATVDEDGVHYEQSGFSVVGFTTSSINTSYTYAIVNNGYALTLNNESSSDPSPGVQAVENISAIPDSLLRWQFSTSGSGYTIRTDASNGKTYYLRINNNNNLTITDQSDRATAFRWDAQNSTLSYTKQNPGPGEGSTTYYLSITSNGATASTTPSTVSLYYDPDAHKVATISPSSTVINLFDYRVNMGNDYDDWKENDDQWSGATNMSLSSGINANHDLKFTVSGSGSNGTMNQWTGQGNGNKGVLQKIVNSQLNDRDYPVLSGETVANNSKQSLEYLFSTSVTDDESNYKRAYPNVKGLLQLGQDGYYFYNSATNYAEFPVDAEGKSTNNNRFNVYDTWAVEFNGNDTGNFFPFDAYSNVTKDTDCYGTKDGNNLNHFFGLSLTTYFIQNYNGYADDTYDEDKHTTFEFSGDDDVWIFVDDVLVADLGGIHDATSVNIDFVTGTVTISKIYGNDQDNVVAYFSDIFKDTDGTSLVELENYGNGYTLVNNSSHTLNFFYLERGGNASNLMLKYNLLEIPATSIYKIDQYGTPLAGAEFAVYGATKQADGTYLYKDSNGNDVSLTGMTWDYRRSDVGGDQWDILVYNADGTLLTTIPCKYHGVTDGNGEMIFQSESGSILSLKDMADRFGSHYFILREVDVPDGYRTVSDESWFHIDEDAGVMLCDSTYTSGVWASNNASVTASNTLYAAQNYSDTAKKIGFTEPTADGGHYSFDGYMSTNTETGTISMTGTLFAVVLKRNDKTLEQIEEWYPVYGSDKVGYTVVGEDGKYTDTETNEDGVKTTVTYDSQIAAVIAAAQKQEDVTGTGSTTFTPSTLGGGVTAQVVLENLPGKIDRYYTYMQEKNNKQLLTTETAGVSDSDPQYFVAYYYTSASSIDGATAENTVRVYSRANVISDTGYQPFEIAWGTTIEVPNMENRLFFQKRDEGKSDSRTGGLLNGAVFALYPAHDAPTSGDSSISVIYYVGERANTESGSGSTETVYIAMYPPDSPNYGKAAVFTESARLGNGVISKIETDHLDDSGNGLVYCTQGGEAGLITVTLTDPVANTGAKEGDQYLIHPVKNAEGKPMVGVTHSSANCYASNEEGTGHFDKLPEGEYLLREILAPSGYEVNTTDIPVLVNEIGVYANAGNDHDGVSVGNGIGYLSKTVDVFASLNEIDESLAWVYGALLRSDATGFTAFDDVTHDVIHVADTDWEFVKHEETDPAGYGSGTVTEKDLSGEGDNLRSHAMVIYYEYNGDLSDSGKHVIFDYTPNDDTGGQAVRTVAMLNGKTADNFVPTQAGQTYGDTLLYRLWTMEGWSDLAIYQDYAYGVSQNPTTTYYEDLTAKGNLSNLFSSSTFVQVTDTRSAVNLDVKKVDSTDTAKALEGAQFRIRRETVATTTDENGNTTETATQTAWYYRDEDAASTVWVPEDEKDTATKVETDVNGIAHFYDLSPTSTVRYYLEEYKAPSGYVSVGEIKFKVTQEGSTEAGYMPTMTMVTEGYTLSAPDDTSGTRLYTLTVPNALDPNKYYAQINLDIDKVDQGATEKHLSGAEFQVYWYGGDNGTTKLYYKYTEPVTDNNGNVTTPAKTDWVTEENGPTVLKTGEDGTLEQIFFNLEDISTNSDDGATASTTYYLVETKAPDGYNLLTEPVTIEVDVTHGTNAQPTVSVKFFVGTDTIYDDTQNPGAHGYSVVETVGQPVETGTVTDTGKTYTITYLYTLTVPNSNGFELPHTGGPGTTVLAMLGFILALASALVLDLRRKRGAAK